MESRAVIPRDPSFPTIRGKLLRDDYSTKIRNSKSLVKDLFRDGGEKKTAKIFGTPFFGN